MYKIEETFKRPSENLIFNFQYDMDDVDKFLKKYIVFLLWQM